MTPAVRLSGRAPLRAFHEGLSLHGFRSPGWEFEPPAARPTLTGSCLMSPCSSPAPSGAHSSQGIACLDSYERMLIICVEVAMPRPSCCRRVTGHPVASLFSPQGDQACWTDQVVVTLDEFEAIRLADGEGLNQEHAAEEMQVSRPTFGRVLESAHRKVADALVHGKALRITGGAVCTLKTHGPWDCPRWKHSDGTGGAFESKAPCGRPLPKAHREASPAECARRTRRKEETTS
jgi:predicted DNA-binding protein (UPF0251 family)